MISKILLLVLFLFDHLSLDITANHDEKTKWKCFPEQNE